tara:strand:+ start:115 stop:729 length:615 start_codon:yes stop_codon:yes gene_type:complete
MIVKINFRDQVKNLLLDKMKSGFLKPEQSLSLASLARELEVSVTPIREALTQLEQSHIVRAIPNKGFVIPELTKDEAKNLYELVSHIEILALENSTYTSNKLKKLQKQQEKFEKSTTGIKRINADMDFHTLLTSGYKNSVALQILSELKTRIFFYEIDFFENNTSLSNSENHHQQIIDALINNNKKEAANLLLENWMQILTINT